MTWINHISIDTARLRAARFEAHKSIQLIASLARSFLPYNQEDKNANLGWNNTIYGLVTKTIQGQLEFQVGFKFDTQEILFIDNQSNILERRFIHLKTYSQIIRWIKTIILNLGLNPSEYKIKLPYALPDYLNKEKWKFNLADQEAIIELGKYFANSYEFLTKLILERQGASSIRCWPHHFDMASLIQIYQPTKEKKYPFIGIGLSPGDDLINEPYYYITPWQYADKVNFPDLPAGAYWQKESWVGAILTSGVLISSQNQENLLSDYFNSGITASQKIVESY